MANSELRLTDEEIRTAAGGSPAPVPLLEVYRLVRAGADAQLAKLQLVLEQRDIQWIQYLMRRGLMSPRLPTDYDASKDTEAENLWEQAKKEEREWIFAELEKLFPLKDSELARKVQALKGGK